MLLQIEVLSGVTPYQWDSSFDLSNDGSNFICRAKQLQKNAS
jgi:hypothetical protein